MVRLTTQQQHAMEPYLYQVKESKCRIAVSRGAVRQYRISVRNSSSTQISQNLVLPQPSVITQSSWNFAQSTALDVMDERGFAKFEFKMSFAWISYIAQNPRLLARSRPLGKRVGVYQAKKKLTERCNIVDDEHHFLLNSEVVYTYL